MKGVVKLMQVKPKQKLILIIMDGWGISERKEWNAVYTAKTPNFDKLSSNWPFTQLLASGEAVGLPDGQMGNSEVGHLNIGAGRIVYQDFTRINKAIEDGSFFKNEALKRAFQVAKENGSKVHFMGLVSDGGVHSHIKHLFALLEFAKREGMDPDKVIVHAITDGRDTSPVSGVNYITDLQSKIEELKVGRLATVIGRYWAMDRDKRWDRTKVAYDAFTMRKGRVVEDLIAAMKEAYSRDETDEFLKPILNGNFDQDELRVDPEDAIIFFNFRADRARQITRSFTEENFAEFERERKVVVSYYVCMTEYDKTFNLPVAFPPLELKNVLAEWFSKLGLKQFHTAETEKYAHVTFFFNGGREEPFEGEDRLLIPSPKVATYDLKPEMSAFDVKNAAKERLLSGKYDFIVVNFANADMVGHTGVFEAAVKAVETVDKCVGELVEAALSEGWAAIVTADHGNAEQMIDYETGVPFTEHTTNPVPFILIGKDFKKGIKLKEGKLADIAPTILHIMGLDIPTEMEGEMLIK